MFLKEKSLSFRILSPCTLDCKLCVTGSPLYKRKGCHYYTSLEDYQCELDVAFQIYDYIECVNMTGGEPMLHKQLPEIIAYTLQKYSAKFQRFRLTTNGTILPSQSLIDAVRINAKDNFEVLIDDYGVLSEERIAETAEKFEKAGIHCLVRNYRDSNQHCGGWVDFGPFDTYRNYSDEKLQEIISTCHDANWKSLVASKGKLFLCSRASSGYDLQFFDLKPGEYIDLFDTTQPLADKREIAAALGSKAINACKYCNGFDVEHSRRFPAGEQY